jgi:hypothetical protein
MSPEGAARPKTLKPAGIPTGAVTFLFSDIEGSTQRWDAHPEAMKAAVKRHERVLNDAIVHHGGYVFKSMGDAFCAAFRSAHTAIAAAIDAQRALAKEDFSGVDGLRVRMGLHTGSAEERNDDYFGPTATSVTITGKVGLQPGNQNGAISYAARTLFLTKKVRAPVHICHNICDMPNSFKKEFVTVTQSWKPW